MCTEQRAGVFSQERKKVTPQSRAHPPTFGSDYLVFSSFTRITSQKPRSIMLLWKRDSCPRGDRDSMSFGSLRTPAKESPLLCLLRALTDGLLCPPGDKTVAQYFPKDPDAHSRKRALWLKGKSFTLCSITLSESSVLNPQVVLSSTAEDMQQISTRTRIPSAPAHGVATQEVFKPMLSD